VEAALLDFFQVELVDAEFFQAIDADEFFNIHGIMLVGGGGYDVVVGGGVLHPVRREWVRGVYVCASERERGGGKRSGVRRKHHISAKLGNIKRPCEGTLRALINSI